MILCLGDHWRSFQFNICKVINEINVSSILSFTCIPSVEPLHTDLQRARNLLYAQSAQHHTWNLTRGAFNFQRSSLEIQPYRQLVLSSEKKPIHTIAQPSEMQYTYCQKLRFSLTSLSLQSYTYFHISFFFSSTFLGHLVNS